MYIGEKEPGWELDVKMSFIVTACMSMRGNGYSFGARRIAKKIEGRK